MKSIVVLDCTTSSYSTQSWPGWTTASLSRLITHYTGRPPPPPFRVKNRFTTFYSKNNGQGTANRQNIERHALSTQYGSALHCTGSILRVHLVLLCHLLYLLQRYPPRLEYLYLERYGPTMTKPVGAPFYRSTRTATTKICLHLDRRHTLIASKKRTIRHT